MIETDTTGMARRQRIWEHIGYMATERQREHRRIDDMTDGEGQTPGGGNTGGRRDREHDGSGGAAA